MRSAVVVAFLIGCGSTPPTASQLPPTSVAVTEAAQAKPGKPRNQFVALDPIAALAPLGARDLLSWVIPGQAQLDLGAAPLDTAPPNGPEIPTTILDQHGTLVRVAVRLEHARFSVWTHRARLMQLVQRDLRVTPDGFAPMGDMSARLHAGAHVQKIGKRDNVTKIRFVGDLEIEGWVPDDALGERGGESDSSRGRTPLGMKTTLVMPGTIIRAQAEWRGAQLAIVNRGYLLDVVAEVDPDWTEVMYQDGASEVHGYYQKFAPPGRTHRMGVIDPDTAPVPIAPNAKVASGTCLYARANGEAIGYVVGDRDVSLEVVSGGWWRLGIDTPYGPVQFAAQGVTATELVPCAPAGSVAPTKIGTPPSVSVP